MKFFLFGYGHMGKEFETEAVKRGHEIISICDPPEGYEYDESKLLQSDVAIEFTTPDNAVENISKCFQVGKPVISGTTGWYHSLELIRYRCREYNGSLVYSSNFSLGVNIFFYMMDVFAGFMAEYSDYQPGICEKHHINKKDAPSGTAIHLANLIIEKNKIIKKWQAFPEGMEIKKEDDILPIVYSRENEVVGLHEVEFRSNADSIRFTHEAFSRSGFVHGTLIAAAWITEKKGVFTMKDVLSF